MLQSINVSMSITRMLINASLAYLLKPFQDVAKELYVDSTLNTTNHLIFSIMLVRWCRLLYPLGFATLPL
jgi:hypothetical protein